ncbi:MAG: DnaJ domain-containing protein, partial [archaeon]|nr:DnaJ domain-containing protein [archaeon]
EIKKMDFETIDSACKTLGLSKEATMSEIDDAYNRLAFQFHPDRNPDESANERFKKIERAYSTLRDYCSRYVYSFRRKDVEKTLMVYSGGKKPRDTRK